MHILKAIGFFYLKLIIPGLILSGLLGYIGSSLMGGPFFEKMGASCFISGLLVHYFIYEIGYSHEYYFYYNIGLSRLTLWITTFALSLITVARKK